MFKLIVRLKNSTTVEIGDGQYISIQFLIYNDKKIYIRNPVQDKLVIEEQFYKIKDVNEIESINLFKDDICLKTIQTSDIYKINYILSKDFNDGVLVELINILLV